MCKNLKFTTSLLKTQTVEVLKRQLVFNDLGISEQMMCSFNGGVHVLGEALNLW